MMLKMKKMAVAALLVSLVLSSMEDSVVVVVNAADDGGISCYDACSTACVQRNTRLMQRCDRKCQIRCGPDSEVEKSIH